MGKPKALEGVRVVELGQLIAGPFAGRMLADFGAEVIKVEPPGSGDPMREWGLHRYQDHGLWWPLQSRNKKLVTLDVRRPEGRELFLRLLGVSDALIENFKPGTLERWDLAPDTLLDANPKLILARVSGYGQTGPYASRPGFASTGEAMGGLRYINGHPGEAPPRMGVSIGDSLASLFTVQGILMALYHRDVHGGPGQVIDASIMESCFAMLDSVVPEYGKVGAIRGPTGSRVGHASPSNTYRTRDEKWVVIAANAENLWQRLCTALERPDLLTDPRFADHWNRGVNHAALDEIIAAWVAERDAAEVDRIMTGAGVVCGPVYSVADIFIDPQYRARNMLVSMEDPDLGELVMPGIVPKLSETPGEIEFMGSQRLGVHNEEVFRGLLGLDAAEMASLSEEGVI
jgi:crotonobetainyl-CoA:carnitine CoA-transferase CaiB-like acyl-CoA transferase